MKSIAQIVQNNRRLLAAYEDKVQPRFLSRYAREPMDAAAVYRKLRALGPGPDAPARVLDLGCGTGWLARTLAAESRYRRANIVGYDLSPNAIRIARERAAADGLGAGRNSTLPTSSRRSRESPAGPVKSGCVARSTK